MDRLRYSDRRRLTESGALDPLDDQTVPNGLRVALGSIYEAATGNQPQGQHFDGAVTAAFTQHFGQHFFERFSHGQTVAKFFGSRDTTIDDVLDGVELLAEHATVTWTFAQFGDRQADGQIERRLNDAFARHRFAYRIDRGLIRRVGSPALDAEVMGPALLATARPGWEAVDRSFRQALHHRRGTPGEAGEAVTDAHAALESALKACGLQGDTLGALARSLRGDDRLLPQVAGVPEAIESLLKRSAAIRNTLSSAHGRDADQAEVPAEVVDLTIHWTGAFIVYLAAACA